MVINAQIPSDDGHETQELAELVNRDMLPADSFEAPLVPANQGVELVIGSMKKFVEGLK